MVQHKKAVERRKRVLIARLITSGYHKNEDGRQLYELCLSDLEHLYINMVCKKGKQNPIIQVIW